MEKLKFGERKKMWRGGREKRIFCISNRHIPT
jgi:hypothetical protein